MGRRTFAPEDQAAAPFEARRICRKKAFDGKDGLLTVSGELSRFR